MEMRNTSQKLKDSPWCRVKKNLPGLCFSGLWKLSFSSNEIRYLAEETSKRGIEGLAWFLLTTLSKMQEERI